MKKNDKNKIVISVVGIISLVIVVATATYAWYVWHSSSSQNVNINLTASSTITFYGGTDIEGILEPVYDKEDGIVKTIRISSNATGDEFSLYLKLNTLPSDLEDASFKWAIYKGNQLINNGDFGGTAQGDVVTLLTDEEISTDEYDEYTLYLWLDANEDNDYSMSGQTVDFDLYATGNSGVLDER